ncbi:hypothetical protein Indivirus_14_3 [Indivirus ILV1]|uniref:Uncharacterized protein n=1 Tax=Indivirus ILV1 TaxID=1977633 RepID=A0A1V0SEF7_9VIRU|nr:hypothetical protein Indivirus_14_3 [Indivirus ILV1]
MLIKDNNMIMNMIMNMINIIIYNKKIVIFIMTYILWILINFISSNLYTIYCVDNSLYGLLFSPIMTISPHCKLFRWSIYTSGNVIENIVYISIAYISSVLIYTLNNVYVPQG